MKCLNFLAGMLVVLLVPFVVFAISVVITIGLEKVQLGSAHYTLPQQLIFSDMTEIGSDLRSLVEQHKEVSITLEGIGGDVRTVFSIQHALKDTQVHCDIPSIALSAHAFLIAVCDTLDISPHGFVMFHHISAFKQVNYYCSGSIGTDRGISKAVKCKEYLNFIIKDVQDFFLKHSLKFLTIEEATRFFNGEDVFIRGDVFQKRFDLLKLKGEI